MKLEKLGRPLGGSEGKSYGKELHRAAGANRDYIASAARQMRDIGPEPRVAPEQFGVEVTMGRPLAGSKQHHFGVSQADSLDNAAGQDAGLIERRDRRDDDTVRGVVVDQPSKMCVHSGGGLRPSLETMADQLDDVFAVQDRERQVGRPVVGREYPARSVFIRHPPDTAKMLCAASRPQL